MKIAGLKDNFELVWRCKFDNNTFRVFLFLSLTTISISIAWSTIHEDWDEKPNDLPRSDHLLFSSQFSPSMEERWVQKLQPNPLLQASPLSQSRPLFPHRSPRHHRRRRSPSRARPQGRRFRSRSGPIEAVDPLNLDLPRRDRTAEDRREP